MLESEYATLIRKIVFGELFDDMDAFSLLNLMLTIHFRNPAYLNHTKRNNWDNFHRIFDSAIDNILLDETPDVPSLEATEDEKQGINQQASQLFSKTGFEAKADELIEAERRIGRMSHRWSVDIIKSSHSYLITTDFPSMIFQYAEKPRLIILPLTPEYLAVAFDKYYLEMRVDVLSPSDVARLNTASLFFAQKMAFSNLSDEDFLNQIVKNLKTRGDKKVRGYVENDLWQLASLSLEEFEKSFGPFEFFTRLNP